MSIELGTFDSTRRAEIAKGLHDIVVDPENIGLQVDFPALPDRYGTQELAEASLDRIASREEVRHGEFMARIPTANGRMLGVISVEQAKMRAKRSIFSRTVADGPNIAYWLDETRPPELRHIGTEVTRQTARLLMGNRAMHGFAWTVVRPQNRRSIRMLEAEDNGFGGFEAEGEPEVWPVDDGVMTERILYIARFSIEQLRV